MALVVKHEVNAGRRAALKALFSNGLLLDEDSFAALIDSVALVSELPTATEDESKEVDTGGTEETGGGTEETGTSLPLRTLDLFMNLWQSIGFGQGGGDNLQKLPLVVNGQTLQVQPSYNSGTGKYNGYYIPRLLVYHDGKFYDNAIAGHGLRSIAILYTYDENGETVQLGMAEYSMANIVQIGIDDTHNFRFVPFADSNYGGVTIQFTSSGNEQYTVNANADSLTYAWFSDSEDYLSLAKIIGVKLNVKVVRRNKGQAPLYEIWFDDYDGQRHDIYAQSDYGSYIEFYRTDRNPLYKADGSDSDNQAEEEDFGVESQTDGIAIESADYTPSKQVFVRLVDEENGYSGEAFGTRRLECVYIDPETETLEEGTWYCEDGEHSWLKALTVSEEDAENGRTASQLLTLLE